MTARYLAAIPRRILLMEQQVWSIQHARQSALRPRVAVPSSHSAFQDHAAHHVEWSALLRPNGSRGTCIPRRVGTVDPCGWACPPPRTVLAPCSAHGSPSLCLHPIPTWFSVSIRMTSRSVWDTRTVSLPLSVRLSTILLPLIPWLIQIVLAAQPITGKRWVQWRLRDHTGG